MFPGKIFWLVTCTLICVAGIITGMLVRVPYLEKEKRLSIILGIIGLVGCVYFWLEELS